MNDTLDEARQLYAAAQRDMTSFQLLIETGRAPHETIGFLAQQACEKFIKAVLVLRAVKVERTHDLEFLAQLASAGAVVLPIDASTLRQLNPYAVALRYEGSEVRWVSEQQAMEMVQTLYQWAQQAIQQKESEE